MTLHPDWKLILTKAWSVRLIALATALSFAEAAVQVMLALSIQTPIPGGVFAVLAGLISAGAFASRFVAQKNMSANAD
jgi:hypothetical protein